MVPLIAGPCTMHTNVKSPVLAVVNVTLALPPDIVDPPG
jgi:hypothetical protein